MVCILTKINERNKLFVVGAVERQSRYSFGIIRITIDDEHIVDRDQRESAFCKQRKQLRRKLVLRPTVYANFHFFFHQKN